MKVRLRVLQGPDVGRVFVLEGRQTFIAGRDPESHLCVPGDATFSKRHFMIEVDPPRLHIWDLQSKSGTFVNGARVDNALLRDGDEIGAGITVIRIELVDQLGLAATASDTGTQRGFSAAPRDVAVRCGCGAPAIDEPPRDPAEDIVYICERCHERLVANPVLPPGYELVRILGRGAMGCVYLANHAHGICAIKQILPRTAMSAKRRSQFLREARVQSSLVHPNIVRAFDLQETQPGTFSMIMEYVNGSSADQLIADAPLAPGLAIEIVCQALDGLAHAHAKDIVHRDIKGANLLVAQTPGVVVKVADLGLAKNYRQAGASGFTSTGEIGGTSGYMPKEQLLSYREARPVSDIFAMGATLYRLLTRHYPRDFSRDINWVQTVLTGRTIPISERDPAIPRRLADVVDKALAPEPADRFQTATEMHDALRAC